MRRATAFVVAAAATVAACASRPPEAPGATRGAAANEAWRRGDLTSGRRLYAEALHEDLLSSDESAAVRHVNNAAVLDSYAGRERESGAALAEALGRCSGPTAETDRRRIVLQRAALDLRSGGAADVRSAGTALTDPSLAAWATTAAPADRVQFESLLSSFLLRARPAGAGSVTEAIRAAGRALAAADSAETRAVAGLAIGRAREAAGARDEARSAYQAALDDALGASHPWLQLAVLRALARVCAPGDDKARFTRLADELAAELRARR